MLILSRENPKEFKLRAKIMISLKELDSTLPKIYWTDEWWLLAPWSNLKYPKRWMRNKRLQKKFCVKRHSYLPFWIFERYYCLTDQQLLDNHPNKTSSEIMKVEDERIITRDEKYAKKAFQDVIQEEDRKVFK